MSEPPISPPRPPAAPGKKSCLVPTLVGIVVVLVVAIGLFWWLNRPIKPVQLSMDEQQVVRQKVEAIQQAEEVPSEPTYEKGSREILLTERELNGLLNEHTTLGEKVTLQLATDAVHARLETDMDPDMPVVGGKRLKARARFLVKAENGVPSLVLDDLTVWGVSLPNDWVGQLKGKDLLGQMLGGKEGTIAGVEELSVSPAGLKIRLKE